MTVDILSNSWDNSPRYIKTVSKIKSSNSHLNIEIKLETRLLRSKTAWSNYTRQFEAAVECNGLTNPEKGTGSEK